MCTLRRNLVQYQNMISDMHVHTRSKAASHKFLVASVPVSTTGVPIAWAVLFSPCYFSTFPDNVYGGIAGIPSWCNQMWHASGEGEECCYPCLMLELISSRLREVLELTLFKHVIAAIETPCAFALYYNCIRFRVVLFIYMYFYTF